jgi:hypothetical protein
MEYLFKPIDTQTQYNVMADPSLYSDIEIDSQANIIAPLKLRLYFKDGDKNLYNN